MNITIHGVTYTLHTEADVLAFCARLPKAA